MEMIFSQVKLVKTDVGNSSIDWIVDTETVARILLAKLSKGT